MRYTTLLFDLDHTLFDFDRSAMDALGAALAATGVDVDGALHGRFGEINSALWRRVEAGELAPHDVRVARFDTLLGELGIEADTGKVADDFVAGLGQFGDLYPKARRLLDELVGAATLALVSNGLGEVVRAKVARLDMERYFAAIVISGEVGVAKPDRRFFDIAFDRLGHPDRKAALIIGDNLTSDIQGGIEYGIDTCWFAPREAPDPDLTPTYRVADLEEVAAIARG